MLNMSHTTAYHFLFGLRFSVSLDKRLTIISKSTYYLFVLKNTIS